jgi:pimeloyl-ACP methyl ester carboxylesterase
MWNERVRSERKACHRLRRVVEAGFSPDAAESAENATSQAHELLRTLRSALACQASVSNRSTLSGEKGPYILVGHSLGGLVAETFAEGYPDETAGIVMVDAPGPDDTLSYFGKLVRVRTLAHRTIPPIQTMKTSPPVSISDAEREQAMKYRSHRMSPPHDRLPAEIRKLQL